MEFALNDEQRALQDAVRSYLRDRFGPAQVRALYDDPTADGVPQALWRSTGEQGWLAVLVPEEHDGIGLGLLDASVIARAFGAGTVPGPWLGTVLLGEAVRLAGSKEQKAALLPKVAAGEVKGAVALLATGSATTPPARVTGNTLTGDLGLVEYVLDRTTRLSTVLLYGAAGERLDGGGAAFQELLDRAAVLVASDLVGIARKALTDTIDYDKTRVQFGKPVGSFQAIKHDLADLHVAVTMAEHAATYAAYAIDIGADDHELAASIAKAKAGDVADTAVSAMIQYHGGIGYTWEHDAHFYFKRSKRLEHSFGDAVQHRERIARLVIDRGLGASQLSGATPGGSAGMQGTGVAAGVA